MSYLDRHEASGLKVGDLVRVTRIAESWENGWGNFWLSKKDKCVGQVYEIQADLEVLGFRLKDSRPDSEWGWSFPYFVLEKVETIPPKPKKPKDFWNLKAVNDKFS